MQQRMQRTLAQIPEDIARFAHEQQLGTPQGNYTIFKLFRGWRWPAFVLPILLCYDLLVVAIALINISLIRDIIAFNILFPFLLIPLFATYVFFLLLFVFNKLESFYPCDKGIIIKPLSSKKFRVVRWEEIETIQTTMAYTPTSFFTRHRLYTIRCHDGYTLTFSGVRKSLVNLDKTLEEHFTRRRLPFQFADYQAGHMLSFGPLSINREGVCALGKMLPWEQVADISLLKDRRLVIYKTGEQPEIWLNLPAFKIPNLNILLALFKRIRSGQSEQQIGFEELAAYGTAATIVQSRGKLDELPDGLGMVAEEHKLGERRLDQNLGRSRLTSWAKISAWLVWDAFLLGGTLICGIMSLPRFIPGSAPQPNAGILVEIAIYCLLLAYAATRNVFRNIQQIHNYTYTFEHGMLLKRGQRIPVMYHWEDIEIVWRNSGRNWLTRRQQSPVQPLYAHTIQLRNGDKYTLTRLNIKQEALGEIIKKQIVPLQMPAIIAAFQAGQTITFGTVQTNHQAITIGQRVLPWSQVKSVALLGSQLVIYDITRRKPWCRVQAEHIPNLFLLFALADHARDIVAH
ncbi:MAG TPA: DUF6585 family protein [Ktedonobacteraceae bacterium]|jgi:hypothetical protein